MCQKVHNSESAFEIYFITASAFYLQIFDQYDQKNMNVGFVKN